MNKADFDRRYKAIKSNMLKPVYVTNIKSGETTLVKDIYYDTLADAIIILSE